MIKKIQIKNYRSCIDTEFELQPQLSVLIGPNGGGKTTVLNALLLLKKMLKEDDNEGVYEKTQTTQCRLKVWFDIKGKTAILTADISIYIDDHNRDVIVETEQSWYLKDFTGNKKRIKVPLWWIKALSYPESNVADLPLYFFKRRMRFMRHRHYLGSKYGFTRYFSKEIGDATLSALLAITNHLTELKYYSASQFTNPSQCPVFFEINKEEERYSPSLHLNSYEKFLYDLYTTSKQGDIAKYEDFHSIVGPGGIGLVDEISFKDISTSLIEYKVRSGGKVRKSSRERILIIPQFRIGKQILSPNQLSEGTYRTITLLFYLITESNCSMLLLEEPEVCIHHGLLSSIIELIKDSSNEKQVVITTHSDFVLDEVLPENVYKVSRTQEIGTTVSHIPKVMSRRELIALKEYLYEEGSLGEYWKHGDLEE